MKNLFNISNLYLLVLWMVFLLITFMGSLGQVTRWDLLDQISMADNFIINGQMYPLSVDQLPHGVSVYFPGTALLANFIRLTGVDIYLVEIMHLIASISVLIFLIIQIKLAQRLDDRLTFGTGSFLVIFFCLFNTWHWWEYAREFKPDTIAIILGYIGLITASMLRPNAKVLRVILGALICSAGLIFKQQYIVFVFGIIIYCIVFPNKNRFVFSGILGLTSLVIAYYLVSIPSLWFWNVTVLSDDGMLSIIDILIGNYHTLVRLFFTLFLGYQLLKLSQIKLVKLESVLSWSKIKAVVSTNPWIWAAIPSMFAAFASAAKVGGNSGNTQLGLMLALPLLVVIFYQLKKSLIVGFTCLVLLTELTSLYFGPQQYSQALDLKKFVANSLENNTNRIMTGSNVYFATRVSRKNPEAIFYNYWTIAARDSTSLSIGFEKALSFEPDYLIVENWPSNIKILKADDRYETLFLNEAGLVAKLRD